MIGYNLQHEKLCNSLKLGKLLEEPQELSGGLMHRLFSIKTESGKYAVKTLNPQVMARPEAFLNFLNSEKIARIAAESIQAVPATLFDGRALQEIDGQYYLVFDWCDGKHIFGDDITSSHCEKIGRILAKIHSADFSSLGLIHRDTADELMPDWDSYLKKGSAADAPWVKLVRDDRDKLYDYSQRAYSAVKKLSEDTIISHGDLEPKNILWTDNTPYVIDWEAAGFVNPMHDLLETAVYWSKDNADRPVKDRFLAVFSGYKSIRPVLQPDWDTVLDKGFSGLLGWLEYSFKRSLWVECSDEAENKMGTEHVTGTIYSINQYAKDRYKMAEWLKEGCV